MHEVARSERGGGLPRPRCNMSAADRWASMIGGAALTYYGLRRFRRGGWILSGFGVLLFRRGATGHCFTYDLLGITTAIGGTRQRPGGDNVRHADRASDHFS
jgi:uncharacterized membrane protein